MAFVVPLAVLLGIGGHWARPSEPRERSTAAQGFDAVLARSSPDVLVLGSSVAGQGVDPQILEEELGRPTASLTLGGSGPAHWYAILKNRVYAGGHRPSVVVVFDLLARLPQTEPIGASAAAALRAQMVEDDARILELSFGAEVGPPVLLRVRSRRDAWRAWALARARDSLVHALLGADVEVDAALDAVFSEERVRRDRAVRAIPVVEGQASRPSSGEPRRIGASYVPLLAELVGDHGGTLVMVRAPLPASNIGLDRVGAEDTAEAIRLFNERGIGWVDLRELDLGESDFADSSHMNERGAAKATRALARTLVGWGVLSSGEVPPASVPLVPRRTQRTGPLPAAPRFEWDAATSEGCMQRLELPAELGALSDTELHGQGLGRVSPLQVWVDGGELPGHARMSAIRDCQGDFVHHGPALLVARPEEAANTAEFTVQWADQQPVRGAWGAEGWWLYPDNALRFDFDEPLDAPEASVLAVLRAPNDQTVSARLQVGGASVAFESRGHLWVARWRGAPPAAPWSIAIESSAGTSAALVTGLRVQTAGGEASWLVGDAAVASERTRRVLGVQNRRQPGVAPFATVQFLRELPAVQVDDVRIGPDTGSVRVSSEAVPPDDKALSKLGARCPVYEVHLDGEPLPGRAGPCRMLGRKGVSSCRDGERIRFALPEGLSGPEPTVTARLRGDRGCYRGLLLAPGDGVSVTIAASGRVVEPAAFEMVARAVGSDEGAVDVVVSAGGKRLLGARARLADFESGPKRWNLDRPLGVDEPATLVLRSVSDAWTYVEVGALVAPDPLGLRDGPADGTSEAVVVAQDASVAPGKVGRFVVPQSRVQPGGRYRVSARFDGGSAAGLKLTLRQGEELLHNARVKGAGLREGVEVPVTVADDDAGPIVALVKNRGAHPLTVRRLSLVEGGPQPGR